MGETRLLLFRGGVGNFFQFLHHRFSYDFFKLKMKFFLKNSLILAILSSSIRMLKPQTTTDFQSSLAPTSGGMVTLKTGRRQVPGSDPGRACRLSRSEFSVAFSENYVNTGQDPLERPPRRALHLQSQVQQADNWIQSYNQLTQDPHFLLLTISEQQSF